MILHKLKKTERQAVAAVKAAMCSSAAPLPRVTEEKKKKGQKFCSGKICYCMKFLWKVKHAHAVCFHFLFTSDPQIERCHLLEKALTPSPLILYLSAGRIQRKVSDSLCTQMSLPIVSVIGITLGYLSSRSCPGFTTDLL